MRGFRVTNGRWSVTVFRNRREEVAAWRQSTSIWSSWGRAPRRATPPDGPRDYGARVAMVERERWGGSCPNVACRPTKAYLVAADLMHDINELAPWMGIEVSEARPNLERIRDWKRSLQRDQKSWVEVLRSAGYEVVEGQVAFVDAHTVRVGDRLLRGDRILIATGSRTAVPAIPGIEEIDWLDHISALELTELPESVIVLGGGPVGLEFGQMFARFGSRVTIVNGGPAHGAAIRPGRRRKSSSGRSRPKGSSSSTTPGNGRPARRRRRGRHPRPER